MEVKNETAWTPAATTTALALAGAYGHGWVEFAVHTNDGALDLEATWAAQHEGEADRISGLRPSLSHTTSSGRLSWEIAADGAVRFTVTRPLTAISALAAGLDGHVVVAVATLSRAHEIKMWTTDGFVRVPYCRWSRPGWHKDGSIQDSQGQWVGDFYVEIDVVDALAEDRHIDALGNALLALLGRDLPVASRSNVLRESGWRVSEYCEIDGFEFFLRDAPEDEDQAPVGDGPRVEIVSARAHA